MTALDSREALMAELNAQVVTAEGHTRGDLDAAFDLVRNPRGWKLPILALCEIDQQRAVELAVEFFQGCKPVFSPSRQDGWVEVRSIGYYAATGEGA